MYAEGGEIDNMSKKELSELVRKLDTEIMKAEGIGNFGLAEHLKDSRKKAMSKKKDSTYAEGGEIPFDIRGEVYVTFKDGREESINVDDDRRFATNESEAEQRWMNTLLEDEDIEDVDGSVTATRVLDYEEGGEIKPTSYQESDNGIYEVKMSDGEIVIVDFSLEDFEEQRNKKDIFAQAKRNYEPSTYAEGGEIKSTSVMAYYYMPNEDSNVEGRINSVDDFNDLVSEDVIKWGYFTIHADESWNVMSEIYKGLSEQGVYGSQLIGYEISGDNPYQFSDDLPYTDEYAEGGNIKGSYFEGELSFLNW